MGERDPESLFKDYLRAVEGSAPSRAAFRAALGYLTDAAREEGRRERDEEIERLNAAHAAQLAALREAVRALADGECIAGHMEGCACLVCDTAISIRDAIRAIPLPDAEDALADAVRDTRIDTVRWCHANPVESSQAHEVESADEYVARALNALGAKP